MADGRNSGIVNHAAEMMDILKSPNLWLYGSLSTHHNIREAPCFRPFVDNDTIEEMNLDNAKW